MPASAAACFASLRVDSTPGDHTRLINAFRTPDTIEATILDGGRATGLYQKFGLDWVPGTMDPRLSALDQFGGSNPPRAIKRAMAKGPPGDPYLALDLLLAICYHIVKHDLSNEAVQ